ncbi:OadG family protein [bacterium]|nr:OadG family protein [bacterium]
MNGTLSNGLTLLGMGMGFVISFLVILIFAMIAMSKFVGFLNRVFPEAVEEVKTVAKKATANVDEAIALAIAAVMAKRGN